MEQIDRIFWIIALVFGVLGGINFVYMAIGVLFKSKKYKPTDKQHTYAFTICAKNEEDTIVQVIESIKKQDYPADKIAIFVIADNCTDKTAQLAREAGAIVYERTEPPKRKTKGSAMQFLVDRINESYPDGIQTWDGVFSVDADNLISTNFVTEYNKAFDNKRYDFFNGYINSSNTGTTFVSAASAVSVLRINSYTLRGKTYLGISHLARGRAVLFRSFLLADGWKYTNLTEGVAAGCDWISQGYQSTHCDAAEIFEEQPITAKIFFRQRMRWSRGRFLDGLRYLPILFVGLFWPFKRTPANSASKGQPERKLTRWQKFKEGFIKRFNCYDAIIQCFPISVVTFFIGFLYPVAVAIYSLAAGTVSSFVPMLTLVGLYYAGFYLQALLMDAVIVIREYKRLRIKPSKVFKTIWLYPFFNMALQWTELYSLVVPVGWKKIPHVESSGIEDVQSKQTLEEAITETMQKAPLAKKAKTTSASST